MKYTKQVRTGMDEAEKVLAQRQKIRDAIKQADSDRLALTGRLADVQQRLASEEADAALSGGATKAGPARRELAAVREDEQVIEARIVGLQARLAESDEALTQAEANLRGAASEFLRDQLAADESEWQGLIESILPAARQIIARRAALFGWHLHQFEGIKFPTLDGRDTLPVVPTKREDGRLVNALLDDNGCRRAYDEAAGLHRISESLRKETEPIRKSREASQAHDAAAEAQDGRHNARYQQTVTPEVPKNERGIMEHYVHGQPIGSDRARFFQCFDLHEQGKTVEEIAAQLEHYPKTVQGWLGYYEASKRQALDLREQGKTAAEIASELRHSRERVERWLQAESVATA